MKLLMENWRGYLKEEEQGEVKVEKHSNGFTLNIYVDKSHVGQYTFSRDEEQNVRNFAEIFPEHRGKGYGTMMLLAAIKTAGDLGMNFEEDSASLTPAMSRIYDVLNDSGQIYGGGVHWAISELGEKELEDWLDEE